MDIKGIKDYSVSGESYDLIYEPKYEMFYTSPKPEESKLDRYYDTEDYISHTDSKSSLKDKVYQFVKGVMLRRKLMIIEKYNKKGDLLDLGAGTGDFLIEAKKKGWLIDGVEPSAKAVALASQKGIFLKNDIHQINNKFDVITMWHVLEHVYNLNDYLSFLKKKLAEHGTLFIAVPNFKSYDAEYYGKFWAAYDVPRHLYHFSKRSVEKLFAEHGLEVIKIRPLIFDAFYVSLLSEYYKTGKYKYFSSLCFGMRSNFSAMHTKEYSSHIYVLKHIKR